MPAPRRRAARPPPARACATGRMTSMRRASKPMRTRPPSARLEVPMRPRARTPSPATGQRSPSDSTPAHRAHREEREPRAGGQVELERVRAEKGRCPRSPTSTTGLPGYFTSAFIAARLWSMRPAEKPEPEKERRLDRIEALLEVGRLLLGDLRAAATPRARSRAAVPSESMSPITARNAAPPGSATSPPLSAATASGASASAAASCAAVHRPAADQRDRAPRSQQRRSLPVADRPPPRCCSSASPRSPGRNR